MRLLCIFLSEKKQHFSNSGEIMYHVLQGQWPKKAPFLYALPDSDSEIILKIG